MKIDLSELRKREKYVVCRKHPTKDLCIWNYNNACQYDKAWDEYTMMARGLITDFEGNIVARPFKKFFNLNETEYTKLGNLPLEVPEITSKCDGSLGILFFDGDKCCIATRGSFDSEQAKWATNFVKYHKRSDFMSGFTYLFEICYPENQIVVRYKVDHLFLLAVVDTETGKEMCFDEVVNEAIRLGFEHPKRIKEDMSSVLDYVKSLNGREEEGVVVKYSNGLRIKIKCEEYLRLHKLLTGFSTKSIWECLKAKQNIEEVINDVPDEFFDWVKEKEQQLKTEYLGVEIKSLQIYNKITKMPDRKTQAEYILQNAGKYKGVVFALLNKKDYSDMIWKMIKPEWELPFKKEEITSI